MKLKLVKQSFVSKSFSRRGYKTFFMLNSAVHEIFPAHKCWNANSCWHFDLYEQEK